MSSSPSPIIDVLRSKIGTKREIVRALLAEAIGTLLLSLLINATVAQAVLPKPVAANQLIGVNLGVATAIAFGVAVSAMASGGHVNPVVTIAFLAVRQIAPLRALLYIVAQVIGAFIGTALSYLLYSDALTTYDGGKKLVTGARATAQIFASYPSAHLSVAGGFFDVALGAAVFIFVLFHILDRRNGYPAWLVPFIVGLLFVVIGTAFSYNAGAPLNPAKDLAARLFTLIVGYGGQVFSHNDNAWFWITIVAPLVGGVVGGYIYQLLLGIHIPNEEYEVVATREVIVTTSSTDKNSGEP